MCVQVTFDRLRERNLVTGRSVAIGGMGPAGLIAVQLARAWGAERVIAVDPLLDRRQRSLQVGADVAVTPDESELLATVDGPVDVSVDCAGTRGSVEFLMDHSREAVALFGVLRDDMAYGWRHWQNKLDIIGYGAHNVDAGHRALGLIEEGKINLSNIVTHELPLSRYTEGVELLRQQQALKVCFLPWQE